MGRTIDEGDTVYFRINGGLVEGVVEKRKTVNAARRDWKQTWRTRKGGHVFKIKRAGTDTDKRYYRHMSTVLTAEQYKERQQVADQRKKKDKS